MWKNVCWLLSMVMSLRVLCASEHFRLKDHSQPEFFILGSPKCGTTSLWDLLVKHGEICKGIKEVNYFSMDSEYQKGTAYYMSRFDTHNCPHHHIDGSPGYLASPTALQRMMDTFTEFDFKRKRFIVVLRDPVYRAYSFFNYHMRHCITSMKSYMFNKTMPVNGWNVNELCGYFRCDPYRCKSKARFVKPKEEEAGLSTFREYFDDGHAIREHGQYIDFLMRWLKYVDRKQLFVVNFDTLVANTSNTANRLSVFLGLHQLFPPNISLPHDNPATVHTDFDCETRRVLYGWWDFHTERLMQFMHNSSIGGEPHPAEPYFPVFHDYRC